MVRHIVKAWQVLGLYWLRDCYSAQVEATAFFNVRVGATCLGVACPRSWRNLRSREWGWRNRVPRLSVAIKPVPWQGRADRLALRVNGWSWAK